MQFITTGNRIMTENFQIGLFYTITFLNQNIISVACTGKGENLVMFQRTEPDLLFTLDLTTAPTIDTIELYGGGAGTMNYNELNNKPEINGVVLTGNLSSTDLNIREIPPIDTTDNNKVLTASYVSGVTSYSWQTVTSGTTNYNDLLNKPEINGHVLSGNQLSSQLGLATSSQGALADTAVQPAELAAYQPLISDLTTIRSGAAAGATAVQPATLANYQPLIDSIHKLDPALIATDTNNRFATDTQLNQIETNKTNILSITPTYYQDTTTTIGTTYTLVPNCAMTIPAQTIVTVSAALSYGQSAPRGVILSFSNNSGDYDNEFNLLSKVESSTNVILSTTAQIPNYSANVRTVYVWCKSSTQAINPVFSTMQKAVSSQ